MRIIVQVVSSASVEIDSQTIASIGRGYLLLVGFQEGDDEKVLLEMANKLIGLRIFPDENGQTNLSLEQVQGSILSVSQFTLYADVRKGRRPSFINAMHPERSKPLYEKWVELLKTMNPDVQSGIFGADMKVHLTNDGPFTIIMDSDELRREKQ